MIKPGWAQTTSGVGDTPGKATAGPTSRNVYSRLYNCTKLQTHSIVLLNKHVCAQATQHLLLVSVYYYPTSLWLDGKLRYSPTQNEFLSSLQNNMFLFLLLLCVCVCVVCIMFACMYVCVGMWVCSYAVCKAVVQRHGGGVFVTIIII